MLHLSPPSACCPPPTRQRQKNEEAAATCTTPPRGDLCTQRALIAAEHRFVLARILHQCHALAFSSAARDPVPQDDASYSSWSPSAACASKGHLQQLALRRVTANGRVHEPDARPVFECNVNTKKWTRAPARCTLSAASTIVRCKTRHHKRLVFVLRLLTRRRGLRRSSPSPPDNRLTPLHIYMSPTSWRTWGPPRPRRSTASSKSRLST